MEHTKYTAILLFLLILSTKINAQTIQDQNHKTIFSVSNDGTIRDSTYKLVGSIDKDNVIRNAQNNIIGHIIHLPASYEGAIINADVITDATNNTIGHEKIDFQWRFYYVQDINNNTWYMMNNDTTAIKDANFGLAPI
jgi:hypothetical protein